MKELRKNMPSISQVLSVMTASPELLAKVGQGFVHLHIVPFGLSISSWKEPINKALLRFESEGSLRSREGTSLKINNAAPSWIWDDLEEAYNEEKVLYFPTCFGQESHGLMKKELIEKMRFPGWQVLLIEDPWAIPREGEGQILGGRRQIETNKTPQEYLQLLDCGPYAFESGLTPEAWLSFLVAHLLKTHGEVFCASQSTAACHLIGAYLSSFNKVPYGYWGHYSERVVLASRSPGKKGAGIGMRSAVSIT
jgi:hypothetical protein